MLKFGTGRIIAADDQDEEPAIVRMAAGLSDDELAAILEEGQADDQEE